MTLVAAEAACRLRAGRPRTTTSRSRRTGSAVEAPGRAAHLPPPARRHGRRRDLPAAPLLLLGQGHRPRSSAARSRRLRGRPGRGDRPARTSSSPTEQRAFKAELAGLLRRPGQPRGPARRCSPTGTARPTTGSSSRWARTAGWASAGRRSTAAAGSARSSSRSSPTRPQRADVHLPAVTLQTVGPTLQALRHREAEGPVPQRILAGDVHFAIGYSEPDAGTDLASLRTHRPSGRRPLRRQRPEDVDHRRPRSRLRLARRPHRPGRPQAQGHLDPDRRHQGPRLLAGRRSSPPTARTTSTRPTTTTSGCPSTCWSARRTRAGG